MVLLIFGATIIWQAHDASASDGDMTPNATPNVSAVRVGVLSNFPPHYLIDEKSGKPDGFAIDIMNEAASRIGIAVEYVVFSSWPQLIEALKIGTIDVIPNLGITEDRARWAAFTAPVETFPVNIFVRASNYDIAGAEDLSGRRISVRKDNVGERLARQLENAEVLVHETWEQALLALLSGDSDAFIYPKNVLFRLAREAKLDEQLKAVDPPLIEIKRALGVRPDRPELFAQLDQAIRELVPTNDYRAIYTKWYGSPQPFWTADLLARLLIVSGILALAAIALFAVWRGRLLARSNERLLNVISERDTVTATLRLHDRAIESSSNGIVITDARAKDDPIIYVNPAFERMTGYPADEMIGRNARFLQNEDRDQPELDNVRAALRDERPVRVVLRNYRKDGTVFWDELNISQVRNSEGVVTHHIGIQNDISDQRATEAAIRHNRTLLQTMITTSPYGIVTIDTEGMIASFNKAAEAMFGYAADEVIGKNVKLLIPEPDDDAHDHHINRYLDTGFSRIIGETREVNAIRKDGSLFPIELAITEIRIDGLRQFTGYIRDVSKRRRAEEDLAASQTRLAELQSEFTHVARLSAMGEMATTLAHELNQPLTAIASYVQACRRIMASDRDDKQARSDDLMSKVTEQSFRAGEIIRRLRNFVSRSDAERSLEVVNDVIEEACDLALIGSSADGVEVEKELLDRRLPIMMDRVQIQQVLVNLLRNSLDAMESCDTRRLVVRSKLNGSNKVVVSVSDTGQGLAPDVASRLFQPFNTSKAEGMGIGLSVCRTIIENHGGDISAENNENAGATFKIVLPVSS